MKDFEANYNALHLKETQFCSKWVYVLRRPTFIQNPICNNAIFALRSALVYEFYRKRNNMFFLYWQCIQILISTTKIICKCKYGRMKVFVGDKFFYIQHWLFLILHLYFLWYCSVSVPYYTVSEIEIRFERVLMSAVCNCSYPCFVLYANRI